VTPAWGVGSRPLHCVIIFVAIDDAGKPTPVPKWTPASEEDIALEQYAKKLMELRQGVEQEMSRYLED